MLAPRQATLLLVVASLAAGAGGCSWLLGISEDPVVSDGGADAEPSGDSASPDSPDAEDAPVE